MLRYEKSLDIMQKIDVDDVKSNLYLRQHFNLSNYAFDETSRNFRVSL